MPLVTLSAGSVATIMCLAPLAESSKRLMSLIEIWCPFCINLMGASFGRFLTAMPTAGKKYVVSSSSFKIRPSVTVSFYACENLQGLFL